MMMVYYNDGDVVKVIHLENAPLMVVKRVEKMVKPDEDGKHALLGIKCYWYTKDGYYQEASFNTKDLEKVKDNKESRSLVYDKIEAKTLEKPLKKLERM